MSVRRMASLALATGCSLALFASCAAPPVAEATQPIAQRPIPDVMRAVADHALANPTTTRADPGWIRANLYPGILATFDVTGDPNYLTATTRYASQEGHWIVPGGSATRPAHGRRHADNAAIGWTYAEIARLYNDPTKLADLRKMVDDYNAGNTPGRVEWWWCDSINMAPPTLAHAYAVSGDRAYLALLDRLLPDAIQFLYDPAEHLFFRDKNFFEKRYEGQKIFWSRGNGWVAAGLARVLNDLPADDPQRARYTQVFRELCTRLAPLQGKDGLWRSNLLVPAQYPNPETSGSGYFVFAMAWGVNHGVLDRETFEPVVRRGWNGLLSCVHEDGKLGYVQPVGADPRAATADMTQEYGVGAFLLAAQQMWKLDHPAPAPTTGPTRVHAMFVPQRLDDFAWENDRIAFRAYGPALMRQDGPQSGIDIWVKRVPQLVQTKWYKVDRYHNDNGEGLDGYHVGTSRGVGGIAIFANGQRYVGQNYTAYHILENGPDRCVFELDYAPIDVGGRTISERKRITLETGSNFSHIEDTFTFTGPPIEVGIGLKINPKGRALVADGSDSRFIAAWEPLDGPASNGEMGTAVILDGNPKHRIETHDGETPHGDQYLILKVESGKPVSYYAGGGWSKAGFADVASWLVFVAQSAGMTAIIDLHEGEAQRVPSTQP